MYTSISLILTGATLVLGGCYSDGDRWATTESFAETKARDACQLKFAINKWSVGESAGACYNLDSTKKVDFVLERVSGEDAGAEVEISAEACYDGFQKEINACEFGGSTGYADFKFT